jgi:hypothetical protein
VISRRAVFLFLAVAAGFLAIPGCRERGKLPELELPPTPLLTAETRWGVANKPYLKVLGDRDSGSSVEGILRRGDIVEVLSSVSAEEVGRYWLEVRSEEVTGWVMDIDFDVYDSAAQARTAREALIGEP